MLKIMDERDRIIFMRRENGMFVFVRYPDMDSESRDYMVRLHKAITSSTAISSNICDPVGRNISDIEAFLDFKDTNDTCG